MGAELSLPTASGELERYEAGQVAPLDGRGPVPHTRAALAAAHVVADPRADVDPSSASAIDWEATLAFRRHLWGCGLGVADAMDTAQRGMGLSWEAVTELITRSGAEARAEGGVLVCGASTDQLPPAVERIADVVAAYEEQLELVERAGARAVLMASRQLTALADGPDDYVDVYSRLLSQVRDPVVIHWLGPMFDPALAGYWGSHDPTEAAEAMLGIVADHADKVDGIKVSMLDDELEIAVRARLPEGVRCYTGDDFHYPELIRGDERGHSDALLGIFDPIASAAATALRALDDGDVEAYERVLAPTVPLAHEVFAAPTRYYKTGVVFLAYLAGHQSHFRMVGGLEGARSVPHLARLFRLADQAGLLPDPELAARRMRSVLAVAGIET